MKPKGIAIDKVLEIMHPHLSYDLSPDAGEYWGIKSFEEIVSLQGKRAIDEARKAYKAGLRRTPLDEGGYWDCKYTDAGRKLLWELCSIDLSTGIPCFQ